jgi:hypothetical protein
LIRERVEGQQTRRGVAWEEGIRPALAEAGIRIRSATRS